MIDVHKDKKIIFFGVACLLILVALGVVNYVIQLQSKNNPPTVPPVVQESKKPTASLTLSAVKPTVSVGESFLIQLIVDTNDNTVGGVQFDASYDPNYLIIDKLDVGDFFMNPIVYAKTIDKPTRGDLQFALGSIQPKRGMGVAITITAHALAKTNGEQPMIVIKPSSLITEPKNNKSVLAEMKGLHLVVQ